MLGMPFDRSSVKHLHVGGLITLTARQKAPKLLASLVLSSGAPRRFQRLSSALRRYGRRQVGELLRLQCEDLVAGLRGLQGPACTLARAHQC